MKHILLIVLLGASLSVTAQTKLSLSYDDALQMLQKGNQSLKIADKGIETARTERDKLNALWYPSLQGAGTYVLREEPEKNILSYYKLTLYLYTLSFAVNPFQGCHISSFHIRCVETDSIRCRRNIRIPIKRVAEIGNT